jgi:hypothetical protein
MAGIKGAPLAQVRAHVPSGSRSRWTAQSYRASETSAPAGQAAAAPQPTAASPATQAPATPARSDSGVSGGLPTVAAYQNNSAQSAGVQNAALTNNGASALSGRMVEVAVEGHISRRALQLVRVGVS